MSDPEQASDIDAERAQWAEYRANGDAHIEHLRLENERLRSGLEAAVANSTILISRMRMHGASTGKADHLHGVCWPRHQEAFDALNERAEQTAGEVNDEGS